MKRAISCFGVSKVAEHAGLLQMLLTVHIHYTSLILSELINSMWLFYLAAKKHYIVNDINVIVSHTNITCGNALVIILGSYELAYYQKAV